MTRIKVADLNVAKTVTPEEAAMVKGGPLEIKELQIRVTVKE